jgi:septum formation protein
MRNAAGKARQARVPRGAQGVVIGADTFLYFRGRIIGKPRSLAAARRLLRTLSGRSHWVYTGLCLYHPATCRARTSYEKTKVTFKRLTPETIRRLFRRAHPLDKAGGYALQADRGELIARIDGSRTNVVGLPLELLRRELRAFGRSVVRSDGAGPVRAVLRRPAREDRRDGACRVPPHPCSPSAKVRWRIVGCARMGALARVTPRAVPRIRLRTAPCCQCPRPAGRANVRAPGART